MNGSQSEEPERLEARLQFMAGILHRITEPCISVDAGGLTNYANQTAMQLLGHSGDEILGRPLQELFSEESTGQIVDAYQQAVTEQSPASLETHDPATGRWLFHRFYPSSDGVTILTADVTEHKIAEVTAHRQAVLSQQASVDLERLFAEQEALNARLTTANAHLQSLATTDALTTIYNYRAFTERMELEFNRRLRYHTHLSLVMLDVDAFKAYNDDYGHLAGDEALTRVALLLRGSARSTDFVARYGGEEFAIILPDTDRDGAMVMAERFRANIENMEFDAAGITVSAGVATVVNAISDPTHLVAAADTALYASKNGGRNRVTHVDEINGGSLRRP